MLRGTLFRGAQQAAGSSSGSSQLLSSRLLLARFPAMPSNASPLLQRRAFGGSVMVIPKVKSTGVGWTQFDYPAESRIRYDVAPRTVMSPYAGGPVYQYLRNGWHQTKRRLKHLYRAEAENMDPLQSIFTGVPEQELNPQKNTWPTHLDPHAWSGREIYFYFVLSTRGRFLFFWVVLLLFARPQSRNSCILMTNTHAFTSFTGPMDKIWEDFHYLFIFPFICGGMFAYFFDRWLRVDPFAMFWKWHDPDATTWASWLPHKSFYLF
ncbi:unnamed protein product [Amoebophrya sp. A120]|nr:unnamed protein product [Amoebophrya sp. A120]|eukprot:GSA120T00016589001.1